MEIPYTAIWLGDSQYKATQVWIISLYAMFTNLILSCSERWNVVKPRTCFKHLRALTVNWRKKTTSQYYMSSTMNVRGPSINSSAKKTLTSKSLKLITMPSRRLCSIPSLGCWNTSLGSVTLTGQHTMCQWHGLGICSWCWKVISWEPSTQRVRGVFCSNRTFCHWVPHMLTFLYPPSRVVGCWGWSRSEEWICTKVELGNLGW